MSAVTPDPHRKDAEAAGRFALDVMKRYRKWSAGVVDELAAWEWAIGQWARIACHWAARSKANAADLGPQGETK